MKVPNDCFVNQRKNEDDDDALTFANNVLT